MLFMFKLRLDPQLPCFVYLIVPELSNSIAQYSKHKMMWCHVLSILLESLKDMRVSMYLGTFVLYSHWTRQHIAAEISSVQCNSMISAGSVARLLRGAHNSRVLAQVPLTTQQQPGPSIPSPATAFKAIICSLLSNQSGISKKHVRP